MLEDGVYWVRSRKYPELRGPFIAELLGGHWMFTGGDEPAPYEDFYAVSPKLEPPSDA